MLADLDLLLIAVFCTADDLLPTKPGNARRIVTDAEVVTLCVAQSMMGIASDERFIATARKRLGHLFPELPDRDGLLQASRATVGHDRGADRRVRGAQPRLHDDVLLVDSTPVECARSRETVKRGGQPAWPTRCPTPPTTATAPATAATSTASGCTRCSRWTAPPERWR